MGLLAEFDVIADFGYPSSTEEMGIIPDYSVGCQSFVDTFLRVARELVPVDTGYLRSTLTAYCNDTYCRAETICEYAQYPEYGTWCQRAQPYFTPALEEALAVASAEWDIALEEAYEEEQALIEMQQKAEAEKAMIRGGNSSSFEASLGSLLGSLLVAMITTTLQAIFGKDFREPNQRVAGRGGGHPYLPDIIII